MNQYRHLLAFDLSSYGAGFAIINQFVDDEAVKVFEISPCGQSAILILLAKDSVSLQIIKSEVDSFFKDQVVASALIENIQEDLLSTYLSQNKTTLKKVLVIFETSAASDALVLAHKALEGKNTLVDFRVIRTSPKNVILTLSVEALDSLVSPEHQGFKKTVIENIQPSLKSFYEI